MFASTQIDDCLLLMVVSMIPHPEVDWPPKSKFSNRCSSFHPSCDVGLYLIKYPDVQACRQESDGMTLHVQVVGNAYSYIIIQAPGGIVYSSDLRLGCFLFEW